MVVRLLEGRSRFSAVFSVLELSLRFAFIFFSHKSVEFDFGGKFVFKGNVEFTHLFYSIKPDKKA